MTHRTGVPFWSYLTGGNVEDTTPLNNNPSPNVSQNLVAQPPPENNSAWSYFVGSSTQTTNTAPNPTVNDSFGVHRQPQGQQWNEQHQPTSAYAQQVSSPFQQQHPSVAHQHQPSLPHQQQPLVSQQPSVSHQQQPSVYHPKQPSVYHPQQQPSVSHQQRQPSVPHQRQPAVPHQRQPAVPYQQQPSVPNQQQPSLSYQQQPSVSYQQQPSLSYQQQQPSVSHQQQPTVSYQQHAYAPPSICFKQDGSGQEGLGRQSNLEEPDEAIEVEGHIHRGSAAPDILGSNPQMERYNTSLQQEGTARPDLLASNEDGLQDVLLEDLQASNVQSYNQNRVIGGVRALGQALAGALITPEITQNLDGASAAVLSVPVSHALERSCTTSPTLGYSELHMESYTEMYPGSSNGGVVSHVEHIERSVALARVVTPPQTGFHIPNSNINLLEATTRMDSKTENERSEQGSSSINEADNLTRNNDIELKSSTVQLVSTVSTEDNKVEPEPNELKGDSENDSAGSQAEEDEDAGWGQNWEAEGDEHLPTSTQISHSSTKSDANDANDNASMIVHSSSVAVSNCDFDPWEEEWNDKPESARDRLGENSSPGDGLSLGDDWKPEADQQHPPARQIVFDDDDGLLGESAETEDDNWNGWGEESDQPEEDNPQPIRDSLPEPDEMRPPTPILDDVPVEGARGIADEVPEEGARGRRNSKLGRTVSELIVEDLHILGEQVVDAIERDESDDLDIKTEDLPPLPAFLGGITLATDPRQLIHQPPVLNPHLTTNNSTDGLANTVPGGLANTFPGGLANTVTDDIVSTVANGLTNNITDGILSTVANGLTNNVTDGVTSEPLGVLGMTPAPLIPSAPPLDAIPHVPLLTSTVWTSLTDNKSNHIGSMSTASTVISNHAIAPASIADSSSAVWSNSSPEPVLPAVLSGVDINAAEIVLQTQNNKNEECKPLTEENVRQQNQNLGTNQSSNHRNSEWSCTATAGTSSSRSTVPLTVENVKYNQVQMGEPKLSHAPSVSEWSTHATIADDDEQEVAREVTNNIVPTIPKNASTWSTAAIRGDSPSFADVTQADEAEIERFQSRTPDESDGEIVMKHLPVKREYKTNELTKKDIRPEAYSFSEIAQSTDMELAESKGDSEPVTPNQGQGQGQADPPLHVFQQPKSSGPKIVKKKDARRTEEAGVIERYKHTRKKYQETLERLENERAMTPAQLDWKTPPSIGGARPLLISTATPPSLRSSVQSSAQISPTHRPAPAHQSVSCKSVHSDRNSTPKTPHSIGDDLITSPEVSAIRLNKEEEEDADDYDDYEYNRRRADDKRKPQHKPYSRRGATGVSREFEEEMVRPRPASVASEGGKNTRRHRPASRADSEYAEQYYKHPRRYGFNAGYYPHPGYGNMPWAGPSGGPQSAGYWGPWGARPHSAFQYGDKPSAYYPYPHQPNEISESSESDERRDEEESSYNSDEEEDEEGEGEGEGEAKEYEPRNPAKAYYEQWMQAQRMSLDMEARAKLNPSQYEAFSEYIKCRGQPPQVDAFRGWYDQQLQMWIRLKPADNYHLHIMKSLRYPSVKEYHEYLASKEVNERRRAYDASQRQLFSDDKDNDSLQSGSRDDVEVSLILLGGHEAPSAQSFDRQSEFSVNYETNINKEPPKHKTAHTPICFGPGGQIITVVPLSTGRGAGVVEIKNIRHLIRNEASMMESESLELFPGPLVPLQTSVNSVCLFIRRTINELTQKRADKETILLWRLLETVARQEGRIFGTDLAHLLLQDEGSWFSLELPVTRHDIHRHKAKNGDESPLDEWEHLPDDYTYHSNRARGHSSHVSMQTHDPAEHTFRQLLLGGHQREALEWATRSKLWGHAMLLAHRLNDSQALESICSGFSSGISLHDPLSTLYSVLAGQVPSRIEANSWKEHLAVIVSNIPGPVVNGDGETVFPQAALAAYRSIYDLGQSLGANGRTSAAHFCLLSCYLLSDMPVFGVRNSQHTVITLIGKEFQLEDSPDELNVLAYQATEILEFAVGHRRGASTPIASLQPYKLLYALKLAELGYGDTAYRYCYHLSQAIQANPTAYPVHIAQISIDIATRLRRFDPSFAVQPSAGGAFTSVPKAIVTTDVNWLSNLAVTASQMSSKIVPPIPVQLLETQPTANDQITENEEWNVPYNNYNAESQQFYDLSSRAESKDPEDQSARRGSDTVSDTELSSSQEPTPRHSYDPNRMHRISESSERTTQSPLQTPANVTAYEQEFFTPHLDNRHKQIVDRSEAPPGLYNSPGNDSVFAHSPAPQTNPTVPMGGEYDGPHAAHFTVGSSQRQTPDKLEQEQNYPPPPQFAPSAPKRESIPNESNVQVKHAAKSEGDGSQLDRSQDNMSKKRNPSFIQSFIQKIIPDPKEVHLPEDKDKSIWWDDKLQKWVGDGVEEEVAPPPPPSMMSSSFAASPVSDVSPLSHAPTPLYSNPHPQQQQQQQQEQQHQEQQQQPQQQQSAPPPNLRSRRNMGGARYVNPLNPSTKSEPALSAPGPEIQPATMIPGPPPPGQNFFMPMMPVDAPIGESTGEDGGSPFSVSQTPAQPGEQDKSVQGKAQTAY